MNSSVPGGHYMSITDINNSMYNSSQYDVKPPLVPNVTTSQETGMEDVKPPRTRKLKFDKYYTLSENIQY